MKLEKYILKKTFSDGPSANLRLFHNSNVAKVSIVKWSQILMFIAGSPISGKPKMFKNFSFYAFSKKWANTETGLLSMKMKV